MAKARVYTISLPMMVNLLVKYKDSVAHKRSLEAIGSSSSSGASSSQHAWQSHAASISTISEARHIAAVEIDAIEEEDVGLIIEEVMADNDVELVEEVRQSTQGRALFFVEWLKKTSCLMFIFCAHISCSHLMLTFSSYLQDFPMYKYPYTRIEELQVRHKRNLQDHPINNATTSIIHDGRSLQEQQQYGLSLTQAREVWSVTRSRPNKYPNTPVRVCIVDTGYDRTHEDLPKSDITSTECGYGDALTDGDGHGTHCAGVIGAVSNDKGIVGGKHYVFRLLVFWSHCGRVSSFL